MNQTAVEFLMDKLLINDCLSVPKDFWYEYLKVIEIAKEMEKEQIEDAYSLSRCEWNKIISSSEYYNETFKK
jgi:hypothetical protein